MSEYVGNHQATSVIPPGSWTQTFWFSLIWMKRNTFARKLAKRSTMVYQPLEKPNLYLVKVVGEGFTMSMMLAAHNLFLWKLFSASLWTLSLHIPTGPLQWAWCTKLCFHGNTNFQGVQVAQCRLVCICRMNWHTHDLALSCTYTIPYIMSTHD